MLNEYSREHNTQAEAPPDSPAAPPDSGPWQATSRTSPRSAPQVTPRAGSAQRGPLMAVSVPTVQPRFTFILLGIIVLVFLAGQFLPVEPHNYVVNNTLYCRISDAEYQLFCQGAKINKLILEEGQYYRLFTMMFLHANILHLAFNGYALFLFGQAVERAFGRARFLIIYFLGGLTASVASMVLSPDAASVGASGAIFALFGAEFVFLWQHREVFGEAARRNINSLVMLLLLNIFIGLSTPSIDNAAHLGGLAAGAALAWLIGPQLNFERTPSSDPGKLGKLRLVDTRPALAWTLTPFLWTGGLVLAVGLYALTWTG